MTTPSRTVCGIDADPEQHAAWAAQWLLRRLRRPVAREEWLRDGRAPDRVTDVR